MAQSNKVTTAFADVNQHLKYNNLGLLIPVSLRFRYRWMLANIDSKFLESIDAVVGILFVSVDVNVTPL